MRLSRRIAPARRRGLTLVELVLSAGLLALLLAAVFKLIESFMGVWEKSEQRRMQVEEALGVGELCARDLDALEPGPRGDLLAEWVFFDTDGDGVAETKYPRVRMVRHASAAELARLQAGETEKLLGEGLVEVIWAVLPGHAGEPDKDLRALGLFWRGERVYGPARDADVSFFDPKYIGAGGAPRPGSTNEVSSSVLWVGMQFATQTSLLGDGWKLGRELGDCVPSWDAWGRGRANVERHAWNDPAAFLPKASDTPLLPRRVRLEFEFERQNDFKRRTRTLRYVGAQDASFEVDDPEKVAPAGGFVMIDAEWLQVTSVLGSAVSARRGQRGTKAAGHEPGAMLHWGPRMVREVPIATHREDWDL